MYPIKNLEDLYEKEGYRDNEFEKEDKRNMDFRFRDGSKNDGEDMVAEGMVLELNRNKREAKGYYFINKYSNNVHKYDYGEKETKYPVEMKDNKFYLTKKVKDKNLENKIKPLNFLSIRQF